MSRHADLVTFYALMDRLRHACGGYRTLAGSHGRLPWPQRGVYFFFEADEERSASGSGLRVVRVGTHAVSMGSKTTLWKRLAQHKGVTSTGGGNHRGSIFRLLVGAALVNRDGGYDTSAWLDTHMHGAEVRRREYPLECAVSRYIGAMPVLWVAIDDAPSKASQRSYIERNSIALLSNISPPDQEPRDVPSSGWLGRESHKEEIRTSGLWNTDFVHDRYDPAFLRVLERDIAVMEAEQ